MRTEKDWRGSPYLGESQSLTQCRGSVARQTTLNDTFRKRIGRPCIPLRRDSGGMTFKDYHREQKVSNRNKGVLIEGGKVLHCLHERSLQARTAHQVRTVIILLGRCRAVLRSSGGRMNRVRRGRAMMLRFFAHSTVIARQHPSRDREERDQGSKGGAERVHEGHSNANVGQGEKEFISRNGKHYLV